jgi:hypothetical protein
MLGRSRRRGGTKKVDTLSNNTGIEKRLRNAPAVLFAAYVIAAAFGTYFCMYAFRKPFTAATFEGITLFGVGYKTVLVVTQVLGYTLSKFIGIKVISEMPPGRRVAAILGLLGFAQISLLVFALVPPPYNFAFLFLNGLPLGMVFGLILSFLEGRRLTEALAAGLCASFIVSSGFVKSVGRYLIISCDVSDCWMPFLTGAIFIAPTILFVAMLSRIPPPEAEDVQHRGSRPVMTSSDRRHFFSTHALGLGLLIGVYVILTIMRSIRDDFGVEIWRELGSAGKPAIFTQSEMLVMLGVVVINGAAILIRDNRLAMLTAICTMIAGFAVVGLSLVAYSQGWLSGFAFMVLIGMGMYVPYVAFHTTILERLLAVFRDKSNIGYLMYLADAAGYLGYVGVMLARNFGSVSGEFLTFFVQLSAALAILAIALLLISLLHFRRRMPRQPQLATA